jgi:hypothetical protein
MPHKVIDNTNLAQVFGHKQAQRVEEPARRAEDPATRPIDAAIERQALAHVDQLDTAAAMFCSALIATAADRDHLQSRFQSSGNIALARLMDRLIDLVWGATGVLSCQALDHGAMRQLLGRRHDEVARRIATLSR